MNQHNYIICSILLLLFIIFSLVLINNYFNTNEGFQTKDKCVNDYQLFDKKTGVKTSTLINICMYKYLANPANANNLITMLKFNKDSELQINRPKDNIEKDFTFGFYMTPSKDSDKKVIKYNEIEGLLRAINKDGQLILKMDMVKLENDPLNNFKLFIIYEENQVEIPFSNVEEMTYIVINMKFKTADFIPEANINVNNKNYKILMNNKQTQKLSMKQFIIGNGFEGYIGNVLLFDEVIDTSVFCQNYNCNMVCFKPSKENSYGGNVNGCIKDCMRTCNDIKKCQNICINCEVEGEYWTDEEKKKICPWLSEIKIMDMAVPNAPTIRGYPGDKSVLLEWKKPFDGRSKITNYIIMYYESFNKKNGIQISIANNPENDIFEHEINNLKNKTNYSFVIRAVNAKGIGNPSNISTIAPNGSKTENLNENIFKEMDDELDDKVRTIKDRIVCDINDYETVGHTLDYYNNDEFDMKSFIKQFNKQK